jgi:hypothetical protein
MELRFAVLCTSKIRNNGIRTIAVIVLPEEISNTQRTGALPPLLFDKMKMHFRNSRDSWHKTHMVISRK